MSGWQRKRSISSIPKNIKLPIHRKRTSTISVLEPVKEDHPKSIAEDVEPLFVEVGGEQSVCAPPLTTCVRDIGFLEPPITVSCPSSCCFTCCLAFAHCRSKCVLAHHKVYSGCSSQHHAPSPQSSLSKGEDTELGKHALALPGLTLLERCSLISLCINLNPVSGSRTPNSMHETISL